MIGARCAIRPIVKWGDPVLHSAVRARGGDRRHHPRRCFDDMVETMYAAPGHRPGRAPDRRAPARDRHRPLGGRGPEAAHQARQPRVRGARGRAAARGGLPLRSPASAARPCGRRASIVKGLDPDGKERDLRGAPSCWRARSATRSTTSTACSSWTGLTPLKRDLMKRKLRKKARDRRLGRSRRRCASSSWAAAPSPSPALEALLDAGHEVAALVTQPDREKGRGRALAPPPLKPVAERARRARPAAAARARARGAGGAAPLAPELQVVVAYGQILPRAVIDIAPRGHRERARVAAAALPRGGADPVGDRERRDARRASPPC